MSEPIYIYWIRFVCSFFFVLYVLSMFYSYQFIVMLLVRCLFVVVAIIVICTVCFAIKIRYLNARIAAFCKHSYSPFKQYKTQASYKAAIQENTKKELAKLKSTPEYQKLKYLKSNSLKPNEVCLNQNRNIEEINHVAKCFDQLEDILFSKK